MGRLDPLTQYLAQADTGTVRLSFAHIERLIGGALPESARRHPAFWSNSDRNSYAKTWKSAGFVASRAGVGPEEVIFTRATGYGTGRVNISSGADRPPLAEQARDAHAVLIGCVATKRDRPLPAKELYMSELFRRRRFYAESSGKPWFILSALHGLVEPAQVVPPYERSINDVTAAERAEWAAEIANALLEWAPSAVGGQVEVHAGQEYVAALRSPLHKAGIGVVTPLQGLRIGEQLQWYDRRNGPPPSANQAPATTTAGSAVVATQHHDADPESCGKLVTAITKAFFHGEIDLSDRPGAPTPGWQAMPEIAAAHQLRREGLGNTGIRRFLTFVAAMDRARDAERLWFLAADLWRSSPWVFDPRAVARRRFTDLTDVLRSSGVSQRHGPDAVAWRLIAEALTDDDTAASAIRKAVHAGIGDARQILDALSSTTPAGTSRFPMLAGPKVGPMWVRMLAVPGQASITSRESLPVAVDVQVRKVTENLGVTDTAGVDLEACRSRIQRVWQAGIESGTALGPEALQGTAAALDPPLWFWGKWGCSFCERAGRRVAIGEACQSCQF
jgi:hypothetical protein